MRIVIAPDSFKESLSAPEAARAIAEGARRACPDASIVELPLADGGEGTVDALVQATRGHTVPCRVTGPLGDVVDAFYGVLGSGDTAVIEVAAASGLHLIPPDRRDPRRTTSRGTGDLIARALTDRPRRLIVGLGGSGTNDGGAGMAQALGYRLLDRGGQELAPGGAALATLDRIVAPAEWPWEGIEIVVACDVTNPLTGPRGASRVFGPQKGASPDAVEELDAALGLFAEVVARDLGVDVRDMEGAGAAGGLGAGLAAFLGANMRSGFAMLAEVCGLDDALRGADLALTGEGRLDEQSLSGKTPVGVARLAKGHGVPCVVLAGMLGAGYRETYREGVTAAYAIVPGPGTLEDAVAHAHDYLADAAEAVVRLYATNVGSSG